QDQQSAYFQAVTSKENLQDFQRAAQLDPQDYHAIGLLALVELLAHAPSSPVQQAAASSPVEMEAGQQRFHSAHEKLGEMARSHQPKVAGGSAAILGALWAIRGDTKKAVEYYRQVVALQPHNDSAWDMLAALLATVNAPDLVAVCRQRL